MSPKWLIGFFMLFVLLSIASGIIEQTYLGESEAGILWKVMSSFQAIALSNPLTAIWGILVFLKDLIIALFKMFLWDYAFFVDEWVIFRYIFLSISAGVIVSLILAIRGTSSG